MKAIWLELNLPRMGLARLTGRCRRSAFWSPLSSLRYGDRPVPELPGGDWVRCRTILGGLCGSDLNAILLRQPVDSIIRPHVSYPMLLGHENVAEVVHVGPDVEPTWLNRRVCVEPTLSCRVRGIEPMCRSCRAGRFGACENFTRSGPLLPPGTSIGYNSRTGGSWGEFFVAHASQLVEVPASLTDEQAVLVDPLACSMHAVLRAAGHCGLRNEDCGTDAPLVLVVGAGIIGLGVVAALRALGSRARIIVDARHRFQADAARAMGADQTAATGRPGSPRRFETLAELAGCSISAGYLGARVLAGGFDVIFDCVGSAATVQDALRSARPGGAVVLAATSSARNVDWTAVWFRELDVIGAYGRQMEDWAGKRVTTYQLVLDLLAGGRLKADGLLTHKFALADYRRALADATDKRSSGLIRAAFDFSL